MPVLAGLIVSLVTAMASFLAQWMTKKLAIVVAVVALIAALLTTLFAALVGLMSGLAATFPSSITGPLNWIVPDNFAACLTAVIAGKALRAAYEYQVKLVTIKATAS